MRSLAVVVFALLCSSANGLKSMEAAIAGGSSVHFGHRAPQLPFSSENVTAELKALPAVAPQRWSTQKRQQSDVEDIVFFMGMPKLAWVIVMDSIAVIFFIVGVRVVTSMARKRPEQEMDYILQQPV
mmetsp:Transcript_10949/g.20618  ORF Transcript_10949/g.20618 Transcript_10949/m.20618 type:complete len:127 (+) Transcript_10949:96-476(+)